MRHLALAFLVLLAIAGCREDSQRPFVINPVAPVAPPPPAAADPIQITIAGACEVELAAINCRDDSTSVPADSLALVIFTLRRGQATEVGAATVQPGDSHTFSNLDPGTYNVSHRVLANDSGEAQTSYSNLVVP